MTSFEGSDSLYSGRILVCFFDYRRRLLGRLKNQRLTLSWIFTDLGIPICGWEARKGGRLGRKIGTREHTDRLTQVQHQWADSLVVYGPDVRFLLW